MQFNTKGPILADLPGEPKGHDPVIPYKKFLIFLCDDFINLRTQHFQSLIKKFAFLFLEY